MAAVDFFVEDVYVEETFESCKSVIMSQTNQPAMDVRCFTLTMKVNSSTMRYIHVMLDLYTFGCF